MAIIEWLEETCPEPAFLPQEPHARAQARAFAQIIACDIHPLNNLRVLTCLTQTMGAGEARLDAWRQRWIIEGFDACAALMAGRDTRFCFGDEPGLADIVLVPQVFSANRFGVDMGRWPRLCDIHAACEALPAFAEAHPTRQADSDL
jgi:maleylacetoacetate isomerase